MILPLADRLRCEARVLGSPFALAPPALVVAFTLATAAGARIDRGEAAQLLVVGLEMCLPAFTGILATAAGTTDPTVELQLSLPQPYWTKVYLRVGLVVGWAALLALVASASLAAARLWPVPASLQAWPLPLPGVASQLVWLAPLLWYAAVGLLLGVVLRSRAASAALLGAIWASEVIFYRSFAATPWLRPFFLFTTTFTPTAPPSGRPIAWSCWAPRWCCSRAAGCWCATANPCWRARKETWSEDARRTDGPLAPARERPGRGARLRVPHADPPGVALGHDGPVRPAAPGIGHQQHRRRDAGAAHLSAEHAPDPDPRPVDHGRQLRVPDRAGRAAGRSLSARPARAGGGSAEQRSRRAGCPLVGQVSWQRARHIDPGRDVLWDRRGLHPGPQPRPWMLPLALATFAAIVVPGALFVAAFSVACPAILWVPLYQFLYVGYWCWGNLVAPGNGIPTINGTLLTPVGSYMCRGFFGAGVTARSCPPVLGPATAAWGVASLLLLLSGAGVALAALWAYLRWQHGRA